MSLLESFGSLVILAIAAVGFLGTFQQSSRAARNAEQWLRGTQLAEAAMEARKAGATTLPNDAGYTTTISEQPITTGLVDVAVTVLLPDGQRLVVHRVMRP
ncbi:MAG: type IV pilus modification PilV family protein [Gemmatimonadaceae bacterium]